MERELVGGRYRLEEPLGSGGMSEVWAAEDVELGRRVALKLLGSDADPARFEREARAVATLAHPNICQLYDYGEAAGRAFMVLEYLGGGTLEDRLVPGDPHPDAETERIAGEIASGLAHAHARGLVHRDLKPANILFDEEDRAKIADFGIARMGGAGTLTEAGTLLGTAAYISPEQAQGLPATAASDVYSFGVILFRMLTGRLPFEAAAALELAELHIKAQPPPLAELRPDAPPVLEEVAEASLEKDPRARPADGDALVALLTGSAETAVAAPTAQTLVIPRHPPPRRRNPNALPFALIALLLLGGAGAALAYFASRDSGGSNTPTRAATHPPTTRRHTTTAATTSTSTPTATTTASTTTGATTTRRQTTTPPPPPPTTTATTTAPPPPTTTTVPTTATVTTTTTPPPTT